MATGTPVQVLTLVGNGISETIPVNLAIAGAPYTVMLSGSANVVCYVEVAPTSRGPWVQFLAIELNASQDSVGGAIQQTTRSNWLEYESNLVPFFRLRTTGNLGTAQMALAFPLRG